MRALFYAAIVAATSLFFSSEAVTVNSTNLQTYESIPDVDMFAQIALENEPKKDEKGKEKDKKPDGKKDDGKKEAAPAAPKPAVVAPKPANALGPERAA